MVFLDTSAIIDLVAEDDDVKPYVEARKPYWTSTICVYEFINGRLGSHTTNYHKVRQEFAEVNALDLTESISVEAASLQDELVDEGAPLATTDILIAATARTTGDELVVADDDFDTETLSQVMDVTNFGN